MSYGLASRQRNGLLALEALTTGLAYGGGLSWASVCLLASFRPNNLSAPYWRDVPGLRSDTFGVLAFFAVAVFLSASEFLRLRRRWTGISAGSRVPQSGVKVTAAIAVSETVAVLATGLVIYLSVNAVTHPVTLGMQATHLAPWPTEGTLRVIALLLCVCSVSMLCFIQADRGIRRASHSRATAPSPDGTEMSAARKAGGRLPRRPKAPPGRLLPTG